MKTISIAALAAALAAAVAVAVTRPGAAHGSSEPSTRTVTVEGTATARIVPDTATFTFGQETEGTTAKGALAAAAVTATTVGGGARGAEEVDHARRRKAQVVKDGGRLQLVEAECRQRCEDVGGAVDLGLHIRAGVHVGEVQLVGSRLRGVAVHEAARVMAAAGADETSGPQFDRSSRSELTQKALREAFADARGKAEALASEAGASLGEARRIEESSQAPEPVPLGAYRAALDSTPIEPGTQQSRATVTVTFSLA